MKTRKATLEDLSELLKLQKTAFMSEAEIYNDYTIQPLVQTLEELKDEFLNHNKTFLVIEDDDEIIGSVRAVMKDDVCNIQKLVVHPDYQNIGLGKRLMKEIEDIFKYSKKFQLFTGEKSEKNIQFYKKLGYVIIDRGQYIDNVHLVFMEKENDNSKVQKKDNIGHKELIKNDNT